MSFYHQKPLLWVKTDYKWWFSPTRKVWKWIPYQTWSYGLSYTRHNDGRSVEHVLSVHLGWHGFDVSSYLRAYRWRRYGLGIIITPELTPRRGLASSTRSHGP